MNIFMAKWDIKDSFWRLNCALGEEWNFSYVLPQAEGEQVRLVVLIYLQMGWTESPPYFCAASETARDVAQKYSGYSIQPIWREVGTTSLTYSPFSCGKTYAKFHSSPNAQFKRQKPSLISHFAMKTFISSSACANTWIIRMRECPHWSMSP